VLNQHAVNLALTQDSTVQLTATPLTVAGTPVAGASPVTFQATPGDSSVTVTPTGLATAHYVTPQTQVVASVTAQGVTLSDTVYLLVTATPPAAALATFSLQPATGDSAKRAVEVTNGVLNSFLWSVTATEAAGDTVCSNNSGCSLAVYYTSSNPQVATIDRTTGEVSAVYPGSVVFTATTLAYGVARRDTVSFTIGYSLAYQINITLVVMLGVLTLMFAAPKRLVLGVGAVVTFCNQANQPVDVVLSNPAAVDTASCEYNNYQFVVPPTGSGNITAFGGDYDAPNVTENETDSTCSARRFPVPGTYLYHSTLFPSDTDTLNIHN
jgi:hypothetical protein